MTIEPRRADTAVALTLERAFLRELDGSCRTPIAGLAYQPKVQHYFDQLGIADSCTDFRDFSSGRICRFLLANWEKRQATREILAREIPLLQKKAMIAADCVAELDAGR